MERNFGLLGLERNFGGLVFESSTSIKMIKDIFNNNELASNNYEILKRISENVKDKESRYLLVISKSSVSIFLLKTILDTDLNLYVGSEFYSDHHSEEYSLKILNKIQLHMEEGKLLILKNLESVYPALYDLFNQNFSEVSGNKYARIAVGSTTNNFSLVDDNFRCIVCVNYEQIDQEEPPFLNRFEKHILSLEYLLSSDLIELSNDIFKKLNEMIIIDKKIYKAINYDLKNIFINLDLEEIQGIIYNAYINSVENDKIIDEVISKISLTLPQDIILCLKLNGFQAKHPDILEKIRKYYNNGPHNNMKTFLEKMENNKNIVYTFTNNLETIKNLNKVKTKLFGEITNDNIYKLKIGSYKNEKEFENDINLFFENEIYKICFIYFNANETNFINYVQFFIENKEKEKLQLMQTDNNINNGDNDKAFVFIVSLMRIYDSELINFEKKTKKEQNIINKKKLKESISYLSGYYQIFIDNLNGLNEMNIENIFQSEEIKIYEKFLDFGQELMDHILKAFSFMSLDIPFSYGNLTKDVYINKLIKYINNESIKNGFIQCIKNQIEIKENLIKELFQKEDLVKLNDKDIISIINNYLSNQYINYLSYFYFIAEKDNFFCTLLSIEEDKEFEKSYSKEENETKKNIEYIQNLIIKNYFKKFKIDKSYQLSKNPGENKIKLYFGFKIPGVIEYLKKINQYIKEEISEKYIKNENSLRNYDEQQKNDLQQKSKYYKELGNFTNSLCDNELSKISLLKEIFNENDKEKESQLYNILLEDHYTLFIFENLNNLLENENSKDIKDGKSQQKSIKINLVKKFLKYLLDLRENERNNSSKDEKYKKYNIMKKVADKMIWIQVYRVEITTLLYMFSVLCLYNEDNQINLYDKVVKAKDQISYNESEKPIGIVNKVFFLGMESILKVVTSNIDYISKSETDFKKLIDINKLILQSAFKLNANLHLSTKEAFSLKEIIEIEEVFNQKNILKRENIEKIISFLSEEAKLINKEDKKEELKNNFQKFYDFIFAKIKDDKEIYKKLIFTIIQNEYSKIPIEQYRNKLLEVIISKNEFIPNCMPLLKKIIKISIDPNDNERNNLNISINPNNIENNLTAINQEDEKIKILCKYKNEFLDFSIIQIFEHYFLQFFNKIGSNIQDTEKYFTQYYEAKANTKGNYEIYKILDLSQKIFEQCVNELDIIVSKKTTGKSNLCKLYCIAYIKIYLRKYVDVIVNSKDDIDIGLIQRILNIIFKENKLMKVIKIYILKIFFNLFGRKWENLYYYEFKKKQLDELQNMIDYKNNNNSLMNNILMFYLSKKKEKEFYKQLNNFDVNIEDSNKSEPFEINDIFVSISINKILSNLFLKGFFYSQDFSSYQKLCNTFEKRYDTNNKNLQGLLELFFKENNFKETLKKKFEEQKGHLFNNSQKELFYGEPYESLLYGFRFSIQILLNINNDSKAEYLYSSILDEKCYEIISKSFIPGSNDKNNLKLESFYILKALLNSSNSNIGYYVCDCGYYYRIGPCGFPTEDYIMNCPICKKPIGYGEKNKEDKNIPRYRIVNRPGHYRIFKDLRQKKEQMSLYGNTDENIPNRTLDEYKKELIKLSSSEKGITQIEREEFLNKNKTMRTNSKICFRLLSFILHNHLFFANCLRYISDEKLKNILVKDMNCPEIIHSTWNLLQDALKEKKVFNIKIFINLIFEDISKIISECKILYDREKFYEFENKIESIIEAKIEDYLKNYTDYEKKYLKVYKESNKNNQSVSEMEKKEINIRHIIDETFPPKNEIFSEKEFPLLKYFQYTEYKTKDDFIKSLELKDYKIRYPLLCNYVSDSEQARKMKYLPSFNNFTNYMVDFYSYKISRADAHKKKLKDKKNDFVEEQYDSFKKSWNSIYKYATKYKQNDKMEENNLTKDNELIYFLKDDKELNYGMYLAAACQNFISWQNNFLNSFIESATINENLRYFIENMKKKIPIQDANKNQILSIDDCFNGSDYKDFDDLIFTFSQRNIFGDQGEIYYQNYNNIIYNFSKIEEELGKLILPEKCLFDSVDKLNFVIFWGEGFKKGQSENFKKFYHKYHQSDLTEDEKESIFNFIRRLYRDNENYDFIQFLGSMQLIIFYLINNNFNSETELKSILEDAYLKLDDKCLELFNDKNFKINKFMKIYFYVEHLTFEVLCKSLKKEFNQSIPEKVKTDIINQLKNKSENEELPWSQFASAVRRFISRDLIDKDKENKININNNSLKACLKRIDLWDEKYGKLENLEKLINEKLEKFELNECQAYEFYQIIGDEDKNTIKSIIDSKENAQKIQNIDEPDKDDIIPKNDDDFGAM